MSDKVFVSPNDLLRDAFVLARQVYDSGFRPTVILVLWRGGTPVGVAVHEYFLYKGIATYHTAVKATSYQGIEKRVQPEVEDLDPVLARIGVDDRVLVVDDIFDSGCTVRIVRERIMERCACVRIATLYKRAGHRITDVRPDFFLKETDRWIVFPHELVGLTPDEIRAKAGDLYDLLML